MVTGITEAYTNAGLILRVTPPSPEEIAAHARRQRPDRPAQALRRQSPPRRAQRQEDHRLRPGTAAAHLARPEHGRAVLARRLRRLPVRPDRRRPLHQVLPDADHRRRHHPSGPGAGHRRRRRRPAGDRHLQAPGRHGRSLRRALGGPRTDRIARRQVRRHRRFRRWRRRLRPRTDRRRESRAGREAGQGRRPVGRGDHHRRHSRQEGADDRHAST